MLAMYSFRVKERNRTLRVRRDYRGIGAEERNTKIDDMIQ